MPGKRFAILKTGSAYRETRALRGDFDRMFLDLLAETGQTWDVFDAAHGHLPSDTSIYDGFVMTGSPASAYDNLPWLKPLFSLVRSSQSRGQPLLGICFGHQVLAQALGGEVRANPRGWDVGIRELRLVPGAVRVPSLSVAPLPLRLLELHRDIVTRLPLGGESLATSDHTAHEIFRVGNTTLGIQGHPEFDLDVIRVALEKLHNAGTIDAEHKQRSAAALADPPNHEFFRKWLRGFLKCGNLTTAE